jgi:hypothetical protein
MDTKTMPLAVILVIVAAVAPSPGVGQVDTTAGSVVDFLIRESMLHSISGYTARPPFTRFLLRDSAGPCNPVPALRDFPDDSAIGQAANDCQVQGLDLRPLDSTIVPGMKTPVRLGSADLVILPSYGSTFFFITPYLWDLPVLVPYRDRHRYRWVAFTVSRIGFSHDSTVAIVSWQYECGFQCAGIDGYILRRLNRQWHVLKRYGWLRS